MRRVRVKKWECCNKDFRGKRIPFEWVYYKHRPYKTKVNYPHGKKSKPVIKVTCKVCGRVTYG